MLCAYVLCFAAQIVFDAAAVSGDYLLTAFQSMDPKDPTRDYLALDLNTAKVEANYVLVCGNAWAVCYVTGRKR